MARTLKSDKLLFWATVLLVGVSLVMVYSASAVQSLETYKVPYYLLLKQGIWAVIGFGLLWITMRTDYHRFSQPAVVWTVLGLVVVALLCVFLFPPRNNTYRWLQFHAVSIQPSEFAKLAAIFFATALLERRMHRIDDLKYALLPIAVVTFGLAGLVILEPDFGTAAVIVVVVTAIAFAAGLSYRYFIGTIIALVPVAAALIIAAPYRLQRFLIFLDPWRDPLDKGFQIIQSLIAVGSGGLMGKGLMQGVQKLFYIPEPYNDFIYAVISEELGLIGASAILICFLVIAWRGLRTSLLAPDRFGALLALGLTLMVALQALVNISVVIGLLPTKGIPLPFVSNGGSSLLTNLVAMGVLLNISQQSGSKTAGATV
jgi:cell division protein FtsW